MADGWGRYGARSGLEETHPSTPPWQAEPTEGLRRCDDDDDNDDERESCGGPGSTMRAQKLSLGDIHTGTAASLRCPWAKINASTVGAKASAVRATVRASEICTGHVVCRASRVARPAGNASSSEKKSKGRWWNHAASIYGPVRETDGRCPRRGLGEGRETGLWGQCR